MLSRRDKWKRRGGNKEGGKRVGEGTRLGWQISVKGKGREGGRGMERGREASGQNKGEQHTRRQETV